MFTFHSMLGTIVGKIENYFMFHSFSLDGRQTFQAKRSKYEVTGFETI